MSMHAPGHTRARWITSVGLGAMVALSAIGPALAASTWTDPVGDVAFRAPAYADVVAGNVDLDGGIFEFTMTVAEAIPESPILPPPGVAELRWAVALDLDPTAFPVGWPLAPGAPQSAQGAVAEGFLAVAWNGSTFTGTWYDRRPLLSGGEHTATSVPFEIDGNEVHIWLDGALIGDPSSFRVGFVTAAETTQLGTIVDVKRILDGLSPFFNAWP